jgi:hypothetical protein
VGPRGDDADHGDVFVGANLGCRGIDGDDVFTGVGGYGLEERRCVTGGRARAGQPAAFLSHWPRLSWA